MPTRTPPTPFLPFSPSQSTQRSPIKLTSFQNRWHPDNPSFGSIIPGEVVKIECVDWTGGQIGNNDSANDMRDVDLTKIHYLTGPFDIEGAEPGDVLVVEIQDVQPLEEQPWGFTGVFAKENGGGFLDEIYPEP
jgi:formamidase